MSTTADSGSTITHYTCCSLSWAIYLTDVSKIGAKEPQLVHGKLHRVMEHKPL